jgi:hypothetical protein
MLCVYNLNPIVREPLVQTNHRFGVSPDSPTSKKHLDHGTNQKRYVFPLKILLVNVLNIGKMIISLVLGEKDMYVSTYHGYFHRENSMTHQLDTEIVALSGFLSRP